MANIGRVLGLDYGLRRIGLAISDPLGLTAQPLATVVNRKATVTQEIIQVIREKSVIALVLGLPRHMNGQEGIGAAEVRIFGGSLAAQSGIPVHYIDERLTTVAAQRVLTESGMSGGKKRQAVDKIAAALILQIWLDRNKHSQTGQDA